MAIVTSTLTVNAAFFREVKEDNVQLDRLVAKVAAMIDDRARPLVRGDRAVELLGRLRDQLVMHFELEEVFGYFEDPLEVAPQLHDKAESLRSEHGRLVCRIRDLADEAECQLGGRNNVRPSASLATSLGHFIEELKRHERAENALILQAFDDDVGVGD